MQHTNDSFGTISRIFLWVNICLIYFHIISIRRHIRTIERSLATLVAQQGHEATDDCSNNFNDTIQEESYHIYCPSNILPVPNNSHVALIP